MNTVYLSLSLPPKVLSPNARPRHWAERARAVRTYRRESALLTRQALGRRAKPRWEQATCQATYFGRTKHRPDSDNILAMLKPAFDGLTDAGLLADDRDLIHLPVDRQTDRLHPRILLTVRKGHHHDAG